jgi:tetratricopeptide (TPR) repeat protein
LAMKYGDYQVAINTLYQQLAKNPSDIALKDSLASLYIQFGVNGLGQCITLCREILAIQPENRKILQLLAIAENSAGLAKDALETYEKLYKVSKNLQDLYQIATLQFTLGRLGECSGTLAQIIADPDAEKEKILINVNQQQRQEVPLKAAALNVRGVLLREMKNNDQAKASFEEALKVAPDFALPKGNIEDMSKKANTPASPANKPK